VFEGNLTVFLSGAPSKSMMVVFCNLFYAFMIIFFVGTQRGGREGGREGGERGRAK